MGQVRWNTVLAVAVALYSLSCATAPELQRKPSCDDLLLDLKTGKLSGVSPLAAQEEVQKQFPCSTSVTEEGSRVNSGGGVFFLNNDFYFYTYQDFIEVRSYFTGKVSPPLLGKSEKEVIEILGRPDFRVSDWLHWYKRKYGCLRVHIDDGKVWEIGVHFLPCERVMPGYDSIRYFPQKRK